jgi:hypothetical protein
MPFNILKQSIAAKQKSQKEAQLHKPTKETTTIKGSIQQILNFTFERRLPLRFRPKYELSKIVLT